MADEPVVKWEPEAKPDPKEGRRWGRAVAVVLAPIAVLLLGLRAMANLQDASSYETGYVVGQLLTGPILGAIIWGLIVFMRRRSGRSEKFLSSGLVAWMAAVAIVTWFSSVLSSVSR